MLFETLDNKEECVGVYCNNELHFDAIPDDLTHTWNYSAFLRDRTNVEYAFLYAQKTPVRSTLLKNGKPSMDE